MSSNIAGSSSPTFVYIGPSSASSATVSKVDLYGDSTVSSSIPPLNHTFEKSAGYKIVLSPHNDSWKAMVHDNCFPGLSRSYSTAVVFEKGYCLADFIQKDSSWHSSHIHLFSPNNLSSGLELV